MSCRCQVWLVWDASIILRGGSSQDGTWHSVNQNTPQDSVSLQFIAEKTGRQVNFGSAEQLTVGQGWSSAHAAGAP